MNKYTCAKQIVISIFGHIIKSAGQRINILGDLNLKDLPNMIVVTNAFVLNFKRNSKREYVCFQSRGLDTYLMQYLRTLSLYIFILVPIARCMPWQVYQLQVKVQLKKLIQKTLFCEFGHPQTYREKWQVVCIGSLSTYSIDCAKTNE